MPIVSLIHIVLIPNMLGHGRIFYKFDIHPQASWTNQRLKGIIIISIYNLNKKKFMYSFCLAWLDFWKTQFQGTKFTIWKQKSLKTQMVWHGRPNGCGSRLPEDKKANIRRGRGKYCGLWPPCLPPLHDYKPGICRGVRLIQFIFDRFNWNIQKYLNLQSCHFLLFHSPTNEKSKNLISKLA